MLYTSLNTVYLGLSSSNIGTLHMCHSQATWDGHPSWRYCKNGNIGILWTICNGNVGIGGFLKMALVLEKSETNGLGTPKPIQWADGGGAPNFHHHKPSSSRTPECQVLFLLWGITSHWWKARKHWMVYYQEWPTLVVKLGWLVLNCIIFLWSLSLVGPQEQEHRSEKERRKRRRTCLALRDW